MCALARHNLAFGGSDEAAVEGGCGWQQRADLREVNPQDFWRGVEIAECHQLLAAEPEHEQARSEPRFPHERVLDPRERIAASAQNPPVRHSGARDRNRLRQRPRDRD